MIATAIAMLLAFFAPALRLSGGLPLVLLGAAILVLVLVAVALISTAERAITAQLIGQQELREYLNSIPAGGIRHRTLRVFEAFGPKVTLTLDDFLRNRGIAKPESARQRLYRN